MAPNFIIYGVVASTSSTMTHDGRKYMNLGHNIRDFGHFYLRHLACEQGMINKKKKKKKKKLNNKSLSVIFNKICLLENVLLKCTLFKNMYAKKIRSYLLNSDVILILMLV